MFNSEALNKYSAKTIAAAGTVVNILLASLKLAVGFFAHSAGLIADGVHSSLDIISSAVSFIGVSIAEKPATKKHPYGYYRSEAIAGFATTFLLLFSSSWIIYEGILSIIKNEESHIGAAALIVVISSIAVNAVISKIKFNVGKREDSLALIADSEHSFADSISSVAVLIGILLARWIFWADGVTAILVGLFILYETWGLGKEVAGNLLDMSNPEIENEIKKICEEQEIDIKEIKTRKLGAKNFAELKINFNKEWKMQKIHDTVEILENTLLSRVKNLKFITIQPFAGEFFKQGSIKARSGEIVKFKDVSSPKIQLEKLGFRTIISVKDGKFYDDFGAPEYLVIDQDKDNKILKKEIIENPYFAAGRGHGIRFVKAVNADQVVAADIGENSRDKLIKDNIKVKIVKSGEDLEEIIKNI